MSGGVSILRVLLAVLLLWLPVPSYSAIENSELLVLQQWATTSEALGILWDNIDVTDDCSDIAGITCAVDTTTGLYHVVSINMRFTLSTSLPDNLDSLVFLQELVLSQCELSGVIPDLSGATLLRQIDFTRNSLSGPIPSSLFQPNLISLKLAENKLTGALPDNVGDAVGLKELHFHYNLLTGGIPESIGQLVDLITLAGYGNSLDGTLPESLSQCASLAVLGLGDNQLTGQLPSSIGNLGQLSVIGLDNNRFGGSLPASLGDLENTAEILLESNQFTGDLPDLTGLTSLVGMDISDNDFTGDLSQFTQLKFLRSFKWHDNHFSCPLAAGLKESFYPNNTSNNLVLCELECAAGFESDLLDACVPCQPGTYKTESSIDACLPCSPGTYNSEHGSTSCEECPDGAVCHGGSSFVLEAGFWAEEGGFIPRECPVKGFCLEGGQCASNHTGVLCSVCADKHFFLGDSCRECWSSAANAVLLAAGVVLVLLVLACLVALQYKNASKKGEATKSIVILINHLQIVAIIGDFRTRWPNSLRSLFVGVEKTAGPTISLSSECLAKDLGWSPYYFDFSIYLCMPLVALVVAIIIGGIWYLYFNKKVGSDSARAKAETMFSAVSMALLFLCYPKVVIATLSIFPCRDIGGVSYLESSMDIRCDDSLYKGLAFGLGIPALLIFCLGIPAAAFFRLRHLSLTQDMPWKRIDNKRRLGMLFMGYSDDHYYWEIVVVSRKFLMAFVATVVSPAGSVVQTSVGLLIITLYLVLHLHFQPYWTKTLNRLETASLLVLFFICWCSYFYLVDECVDTTDDIGVCSTTAGRATLTALAIMLVMCLVLTCIVSSVSALKREGRLEWVPNLARRMTMRPVATGAAIKEGSVDLEEVDQVVPIRPR